ncbi:hypothetical protein GTR04_2804 [Trichophyton interdigitale]|uniref:Uncharacterized protein n=1 Tax=Trichophyton interdigitale TaxID=101480 RepID=A0A9P5CY28_9EURO|nr:hypothetical protein GY631_2625 [Trichophyton interdigitale]KAF3897508.1 hypothetical protein GY632_2258 [Trichophyton interdigitale]KAG8209827.1 hypothetical protein GTR04_2804 [Trichophyton interdigitale]
MCIQEDQVFHTYKCGHKGPDNPAAQIYPCDEAKARGSFCEHPEKASKGKSRGTGLRFVCIECRKKKPPPKPEDDGSAGAGGSVSTPSGGVAVGA